MFRVGSLKGAFTSVKKYFYTHCEDEADEEPSLDGPDLIEQAEAELANERQKIKTPIQYEDLRGVLQGCSTNNYDGFRFIVQKQVNLNTAVSHFYWLGSAAMQGNPMYQYRIVLPLDDNKTINVATDLDFNVEGEVKWGLNDNTVLKTNFAHSQQQQMLSMEANVHDDCSTAQFKYTRAAGEELSFSYMQMVFPTLSFGGSAAYSMKAGAITSSVGFHFDPKEFTLAAQYDNTLKVMYMKKVNPNRVHLGTEFTVDEQGQATMGVLAEFTLKQAKLQLGLDSAGVVSSQLDTNISPGTTLQLCAQMQQFTNHYKFGFGIIMG